MKRLIFGIATAAALVSMAVNLAHLDRNLELLTLDLRFRLFPDTASASDSILIIGVDDASLESLNWLGWPWPRQVWSDMAAYLYDNGAKVVYYDITFSTSSTFSATEDSVFGEVAKRGKTVFITGLGHEEGLPIPENALLDLNLPESGNPPYRYASPPVAPIAEGAALLASPYAFPDSDGIFRKIPLFFQTTEGAVPSPALAIAVLFTDDFSVSFSNGTLHWAKNAIPLSNNYEMQIRFAGPTGTYKTLGVSDLFAAMSGDSSSFKPSEAEGKIILIGYTASDLMDLKPMPYSGRSPGVEVVANTLDNLLSGRYVATVGTATTFLLTFLLSFAVAAALALIPRVIPAALTGMASILFYAGTCLFAFSNWDLWLKAVPPLASATLTLLAGSVVAYQYATREKRFLKAAFSQYLSPAVVSQVSSNPSMLKLGGEKKVMTAFFSDVAGFTGISEKLDPQDLVKLLNIYLSEMTDIILEHGGTVDKFEGDAIIAFWGAPVEYEDHAYRAVVSAMECQHRHIALNQRLSEMNFPPLSTRIGLATGPMVVGNMGSSKRFDYTMMGSDVNLASRLEGVNKVYGTSVLVSDLTRQLVSDLIFCREIDTVLVVGQKTPVTIWEPMLQKSSSVEPYLQGLEKYRSGDFRSALQIFSTIKDDPPAKTMASRCRNFLETGSPREWDGIWHLTSK